MSMIGLGVTFASRPPSSSSPSSFSKHKNVIINGQKKHQQNRNECLFELHEG